MLKAKIDEHTSLIVYSEWDSGIHKCFKAHIHREREYCGESLTKEQIQEIELTIMSKLFSMVKGQ